MATVVYYDPATGGTVALILTVEGCPYLFTTKCGVTSFAFTGNIDSNWPTGGAVDPAILDGWLAAGKVKTSAGQRDVRVGWSERIKWTDGDLDVSQLTLVLHDAPAPSGAAAGSNVMTYLADREEAVTETALTGVASLGDSMTSTSPGDGDTFTVANGAIFGSAPFTVWIGREAIYCDARSSNTLTVATGGRGALGTAAAAHTIDAATGYYPTVASSFPFLSKRRVILWVAGVANGVATDPRPLYRGYINDAPRLGADLALYELQCDHVWTLADEVTLGPPTQACRVAGYYTDDIPTPLGAAFYGVVGGVSLTGVLGMAAVGAFYPTLSELCGAVNADLITQMQALSPVVTGTPQVVPSGHGIRFGGTISGGTSLTAYLLSIPAAPTGGHNTIEVGPRPSADLPQVEWPDFPTAIAQASFSSALKIHMGSTQGLPVAWPSATTSDASRGTSSQAVLSAQAGDFRLQIVPTAADIAGNSVVNHADRTVKGTLELYSSNNARVDAQSVDGIVHYEGTSELAWIVTALPFAYHLQVATRDWLHGIQYGLVGDTLLAGTTAQLDVDPRDFDWSRIEFALAHLPALLAARRWLFDGTQTLRGLITTNCQFSGMAPSLKDSRIALAALAPPLASDTFDAAHTITLAEQTGMPGWTKSGEIINTVDVSITDANDTTFRWVINDQPSQDRYGARKAVELPMRGIEVTPELRALGPDYLRVYLLARILGLWSRPVALTRVKVSLAVLGSVSLLDGVQVTTWGTPTGSGSRGGTRNGVVVGREIELTGPEAGVTLELLTWPRYNRVSGFAPCLRCGSTVSTTSVADDTVTVALAYMANVPSGGPTDYAGSNQTALYGGAIVSDGGLVKFTVGDKVELFERDATSPARQSLVVAAIDLVNFKIRFTTGINATMKTKITGSLPVDVRYDSTAYSTAQTAQKAYCWVGDRATRVIGGTADAVYRWSP